jgi:pSer/pThr/pTyr-binding forkhead associated (FHA) protein/ABC-type multidrug transport system ATPase subunit
LAAKTLELEVVLPNGASRRYGLSRASLSVGRASDNDVVIEDAKVSGHHARVALTDRGATIVDLGSTNGTTVNGRRIQPQVPTAIRPSDIVQVGGSTLSLKGLPQAANREASGRSGASFVLQMQVGGRIDEMPVAKRELNIGRARDNDVVLAHARVSAHHARLRFDDGGVSVMDLGSTNGTLVNGQSVPRRVPQPLSGGDRIQIGDFVFAVRMATTDAPAPPKIADQVTVSQSDAAGLMVYVSGRHSRHLLTGSAVTLGRAADNDLVVSSTVVSGHHARLERSNGAFRITDLDSSNGLTFGGQRIKQRVLSDGDVLYIGRDVAIEFRDNIGFRPMERAGKPQLPTQMLQLNTDSITIGRARDNALVLDHPQVSRYHAVVERLGTRQRITDLKSANGVFVGGKRIEKQEWLKEGDEIRIGPYRLRLGQNVLQRMAEEGLRIDALRLNKWVSKKLNLLKDISLSIHPQEFVALVGLSGAGKSTLMDAINGFRPATHGAVLVNGVNLYQQFDMFRNEMGYVPQRDIVHTELTVYKALDYAAQLRMPADTRPDERHRRILEVLEELDLTERKDLPIHKLSGGQLKRVSIGVELLTKPRLFFLDEPTSGLDPGTEYNMMRLLRKLADQGRTIVLITHATKNVMMCDKVIILVRGGRIAFYGPPEEALKYFDQFRTDQERRTKDIEFDDIYALLEDESRGTPQQWDERYRKSRAFGEYVVSRLREHRDGKAAEAKARPGVVAESRKRAQKGVSALRQFFILSRRNLRIMTQDKASLALMLALSPVIGVMDFMWGRNLFDPVDGDPGKIITMLFMMGLIAILVGALASVREIVKEIDIYKRERAINLKIVPYIFSKIWVGLVLSLYQALVFLIAKWLLTGLGPGQLGPLGWTALFVTLFLGALSGYLMGLAISAGAPNQNVALLLVIVVLVPQFLFAGGLMPLDLIPGGEYISYLVSARWSFEAAVNITGFGQPLVDDPCWDSLPKEGTDGSLGWNDYINLSSDEKAAAGCQCMGAQVFSGPCGDFPGILNPDFYTDESSAALAQTEPPQPGQATPWPTFTPYPTLTPYPTPTPYPTFTPLPEPAKPGLFGQGGGDFEQYQEDMKAQGEEYQALREQQGEEYQQLREEQGDEYRSLSEEQGSEYQDLREQQGDEFESSMEDYGDARSDWQRNREQAIGGAEGLLKALFEGYGHAFRGSYIGRWLISSAIGAGLLVLIVVFQKRKDTV